MFIIMNTLNNQIIAAFFLVKYILLPISSKELIVLHFMFIFSPFDFVSFLIKCDNYCSKKKNFWLLVISPCLCHRNHHQHALTSLPDLKKTFKKCSHDA